MDRRASRRAVEPFCPHEGFQLWARGLRIKPNRLIVAPGAIVGVWSGTSRNLSRESVFFVSSYCLNR